MADYLGDTISRRYKSGTTITVAAAHATSTAIDFRPYADIMFRRSSGSLATGTLYACATVAGTYTVVKDSAGVNVTIAFATTDWTRLNLEAFAVHFIKLQGDVAGVVEYMAKG